MSADQFARIYEIIWACIAISVGFFGTFYTKKFIDLNTRGFEFAYSKTKFFLFKKQAEGMQKSYIYLLTKLLGIIFLVIGILTLFGFIKIQ